MTSDGEDKVEFEKLIYKSTSLSTKATLGFL